MPIGVLVARFFRLPILLEVNAPLFYERNKHDGIFFKRIAKWTEIYCWKNADYVLPVSKVLENLLCVEGVDKNKMTVIHNGVNLDVFSKQKKRAEKKSEIILGFVGYIRDWHGLDRLFPLLAKNKKYRFLIIGEGPDLPRLKKIARKENLLSQITFFGVATRAQIPDLITTFDIALQPNVVSYASPLKLFEYLASGCAIVAPDQENIREILTDNENALLFEVDDFKDFYQKIDLLVKDSTLRDKLQKNAYETILRDQFLWHENAKRIIKIAQRFC